MKSCKVVEEKAAEIEVIVAKRTLNEMETLVPYIENVIWSVTLLNVEHIKPFIAMIYNHFGPNFFAQLKQFGRVSGELKECKEDAKATEVANYLEGAVKRNNLPHIDVQALLSEVKASYNPFLENTAKYDSIDQNTTANSESDRQKKEIHNMLDGYDLSRKNSLSANQNYLEAVRKIRELGI